LRAFVVVHICQSKGPAIAQCSREPMPHDRLRRTADFFFAERSLRERGEADVMPELRFDVGEQIETFFVEQASEFFRRIGQGLDVRAIAGRGIVRGARGAFAGMRQHDVVEAQDVEADDAIVLQEMFGERGGAVMNLLAVTFARGRAESEMQRADSRGMIGCVRVEQFFGFEIVKDVGHGSQHST